jgi:hypothetical protein
VWNYICLPDFFLAKSSALLLKQLDGQKGACFFHLAIKNNVLSHQLTSEDRTNTSRMLWIRKFCSVANWSSINPNYTPIGILYNGTLRGMFSMKGKEFKGNDLCCQCKPTGLLKPIFPCEEGPMVEEALLGPCAILGNTKCEFPICEMPQNRS